MAIGNIGIGNTSTSTAFFWKLSTYGDAMPPVKFGKFFSDIDKAWGLCYYCLPLKKGMFHASELRDYQLDLLSQ